MALHVQLYKCFDQYTRNCASWQKIMVQDGIYICKFKGSIVCFKMLLTKPRGIYYGTNTNDHSVDMPPLRVISKYVRKLNTVVC